MLRTLHIRDFVIVERLELAFGEGFTVLTGETGAGKSLLVDALSLVLGERSDTAWVREGADKAEISAEFDITGQVALRQMLQERDLLEGDELLLRRVLERSGRSRAYLNGSPATLQQLREVGEFLVDIHGQHMHQSLLRPASQRDLLDSFAQAGDLVRQVRKTHGDWQSLRAALSDFEKNAAALAREREELEDKATELRRLKVADGEWEALEVEHRRLANSAGLIQDVDESLEMLAEGESNLLGSLHGLTARLRQSAALDPSLGASLELVEAAQIQLQEASHGLRHYRDRTDLDPKRLSEVEGRIQALHATARKFRLRPQDLLATLAQWDERLGSLKHAGDAKALAEQEALAATAYEEVATQLSARRLAAAEQLSSRVTQHLQKLAMAGSLLKVTLEPLEEPAAFGQERVEFLVSTHKGAPPRPLGKVASGGELSRLSLAIQTVTSEVANVPTLIFDEVDAGIGGGVAEVVGRMMRKLGSKRQVLCVTHLPQVAAAAQTQWRVAKRQSGQRTASMVEVLDSGARVEEVARMLGGIKITETTRQHAAEMIGEAAR